MAQKKKKQKANVKPKLKPKAKMKPEVDRKLRPTPKGYDVRMIRDFLDHLNLELRLSHYGHERLIGNPMGDKPANPELGEQLEKYRTKYERVLLLVDDFPPEVMDPKYRLSHAQYHTQQAGLRDRQLKNLKAMQRLFKEALKCSSMPMYGPDGQIKMPAKAIQTDKFLKAYDPMLHLYEDDEHRSE